MFGAAGFLALMGTVAGWFGEWAWWLDLGAHFKVQYAAVFCVLCAGLAWERRWVWAAAAACLAGVNLAPVRPFLPFAGQPGPDAAPHYSAMLMNVNTAHGDPSRVAAAIRAEKPDILLLEEVNDAWLAKLEPVLAGFPSRLTAPRTDNFGMALYSRHPWTSARVLSLGDAGVPSMCADISLGKARVVVVGTHPVPPICAENAAYRDGQLADVAQFVRKIQGPVLLIGDLNATPWSWHFRRLMAESGLRNSSEGRGIHASWPAFAAFLAVPIDHCLHSDDVRIVRKRLWRSVGSDHLPVVVDFTVKE